jgi:inosine triphosphate pyrophosphatase
MKLVSRHSFPLAFFLYRSDALIVPKRSKSITIRLSRFLTSFDGNMPSQLPTLTFVTGNKKKLEEVKHILSSNSNKLPFEITNEKIDLPELQGDDPVEIAKEKCKLAAEQVKGACFTEDTSLCFYALNGLPGPYIKWFLEKCGHDGLNKMLVGFNDNSAYAQTVFAFTIGPGHPVEVFDGRTEGEIVPPRGSLDFGWDPVFEPLEGNGKTYAEMSKDEKNAISHRSRSLAKLSAYLSENAESIAQDLSSRKARSS